MTRIALAVGVLVAAAAVSAGELPNEWTQNDRKQGVRGCESTLAAALKKDAPTPEISRWCECQMDKVVMPRFMYSQYQLVASAPRELAGHDLQALAQDAFDELGAMTAKTCGEPPK